MAYITIELDEKGRIASVMREGKHIHPETGEKRHKGKHVINIGIEQTHGGTSTTPSTPRPSGGESGSSTPPSEGTDPCCIRDVGTGKVWCWC